ncbi:hypothetical protein B296_00032567 [Ensete ventricosum]|uniref:Calmodulin-binding domain-containing protein n=1 Tax=Ensete ventricosum TaxID=4639 RepID=A0A426YJR6_ENSVE|nr:hypothetical protein B296_00032567 [Ensete ventricosum]
MSEEAMERVIEPVTPEVPKPKNSIWRNSTGKTKSSPSFSEGEEKSLPHYLRTSTSSCHDFCKYGKKHDLEIKKRHPVRQKLLANKEISEDGNNKTNVATQQEKRKKENTKLVVSKAKNQGTKRPVVVEENDVTPEKIIQISDSVANLGEGSVQESSSYKFNFALDEQATDAFLGHSPGSQADETLDESTSIMLLSPSLILTSNESTEHRPSNPSEGSSEMNASINLDQKTTENGELAPMEESSAEPVIIRFMISSSVQHSSDSALHMTVMEDKASAEHITSSGSDTSPDESIGSLRSSDLLSSMKPENLDEVTSARNRHANDVEGYTEEDIAVKQEATCPTGMAAGSFVYQEEGSSKKGKRVSGSSIGVKAKRDADKIKRPNRVVGASDRAKVIRQAKTDLSGVPNGRIAPTLRKTISSVKPETKQRMTPVTPRVLVRKKAISGSKDHDASVQRAASIKIKNLSFKATSQSTSSGGLTHGNKKITKVSSQPDRREKVLGQSLSSRSLKPHTSRVSATKSWIHRNVAPASQVKNQARSGKPAKKKETSSVSEPKSEKLNLKTTKQNLKKLNSHPSDEKDCNSGPKLVELSKSGLQKAVTQRMSSVISKGAIQSKHRRTATVDSGDKISTAYKLKFNRGKVVSLQHENNAPRILRFRLARTASNKKNSKGDVQTKGWTGPGSADSYTPMSKAPTVVLRHQDVREKKDTQGLLNQVIEETASKLVETRKSKVKALVGAFESVISLQESKVAPLAAP